MWNNILKILEAFSYIATIGGVFLIFVGYKTFKKDIEKDNKENENLLINNSIKVLRAFAENIIPLISEARSNISKYSEEILNNSYENLSRALKEKGEDPISIDVLRKDNSLSSEIQKVARDRANIIDIFNKLEQLSVYINYGLVDEDVVFTSIHAVFLKFMRENYEYLDFLITEDIPYKQLSKLYISWNSKDEVKKIEKEEKELAKKKEKLQN